MSRKGKAKSNNLKKTYGSAYNFFQLCQSRLRQIRVKLKTILRCITVHLRTHSFEIKPWLSYEHSDILIWSCFHFTKGSIHLDKNDH